MTAEDEYSGSPSEGGIRNPCKFCKKVKAEDMSDNTLQLVSTITEFNQIHGFMNDDELDRAMAIVVKLIVNKGQVPPSKAVDLITELQAHSTKFALASVAYATFNSGSARSTEAHKKNVYYTAKEAINKLVDALKITVRYGYENE